MKISVNLHVLFCMLAHMMSSQLSLSFALALFVPSAMQAMLVVSVTINSRLRIKRKVKMNIHVLNDHIMKAFQCTNNVS